MHSFVISGIIQLSIPADRMGPDVGEVDSLSLSLSYTEQKFRLPEKIKTQSVQHRNDF